MNRPLVPPSTYAEAAPTYHSALAWACVLPLKSGTKLPPPAGFTGAAGIDTSGADIAELAKVPRYLGTEQTALRLSDDVAGIDVDHYGQKKGGDTLTALIKKWGPLPDAPITSSRAGISGIRLFRVPPGTRLITALTDIEIIQRHHRYALVWPSVHPVTGDPYCWRGTAGPALGPCVDDLPKLPAAWVEGLRAAGDAADAMPAASGAMVASFIAANSTGSRPWRGALARFEKRQDGVSGRGRHDSAYGCIAQIVNEAGSGQYPAEAALDQLWEAFLAAGLADGSRTEATAQLEFHGMLAHCVGQVVDLSVADIHARTAAGRRGEPAPGARYGARTSGSSALKPGRPPGLRVVPDAGQDASGDQGDGEQAGSSDSGREETSEDDATAPADSWSRVDLSALIDGTYEPIRAELLRRLDGQGLFYRNKVNWLSAPPENGKSWAALIAAAQVLADGGRVLFLDYESTARTVVHRLRMLGVSSEALRERFDYRQPATPGRSGNEFSELLDNTYDFAVIDGVNACLSTYAAEVLDTGAVTKWAQELPFVLARRTGAGVLCVDHVPKNGNGSARHPFGSQAKLAVLDGAAYVCTAENLRPGQVGWILLRVAKDREGAVREVSGTPDTDGMQESARITIDFRTFGQAHYSVDAPGKRLADNPIWDEAQEDRDRRKFDEEVYELVAKLVSEHRGPVRGEVVKGKVKRNRQEVVHSLARLTHDKRLQKSKDGRADAYSPKAAT